MDIAFANERDVSMVIYLDDLKVFPSMTKITYIISELFFRNP